MARVMTDSDRDIKLFVLEEFVERHYARLGEANHYSHHPSFWIEMTSWDIRKAKQAAVAWVQHMTGKVEARRVADLARRLPPVKFEAVGISSCQCPECGSIVEHRDGVAWLQIHRCVDGAMRRVRAA